jgi:hypothetical protein
MKTDVLLKTALFLLVVGLAVTLTSWFSSERNEALAANGAAAGQWIIVSEQNQHSANESDSLIYVLNTEKETLLVYAFWRRTGARGSSRMLGDLEFLAGRHIKWDLLYSQKVPYPYKALRRRIPSGLAMPTEMKQLFEKESR